MVDVSLSATANNKREDAVQQSNKTIDCTTNSNAAIKDSNGSLNPLKSPAAAPQYTTPSYSSLASSTAINGQTSRHKLNNSSSTSNTKKPKNSKIVNDVYQWPVFMALIPPFLAFYYGGKVEEWSETFLLIIVGGYLYGLIKRMFTILIHYYN